MISHYIFNKSKKKSIIFLHGLHANSGFWLPYMRVFKCYKLILVDIDFIGFIRNNSSVELLNQYLKEFELYNDCIAIVSHSLGTVISSQLSMENSITKFEISPVYLSYRYFTTEFAKKMASFMQIHQDRVLADLILVDKYVDSVKLNSEINRVRLLPKEDVFFKFKLDYDENIYFSGDHFNIDNAIVIIANKLD